MLISVSVQRELFKKEEKFFSSLQILQAVSVKDDNLCRALELVVDEGEAEVMALAMKLNLPVLIDDLKGRRVAEKLGLKIIGCLGLLKIARDRKIITEAKPFIKNFINNGYYIDEVLVKRFLDSLGEKW